MFPPEPVRGDPCTPVMASAGHRAAGLTLLPIISPANIWRSEPLFGCIPVFSTALAWLSSAGGKRTVIRPAICGPVHPHPTVHHRSPGKRTEDIAHFRAMWRDLWQLARIAVTPGGPSEGEFSIPHIEDSLWTASPLPWSVFLGHTSLNLYSVRQDSQIIAVIGQWYRQMLCHWCFRNQSRLMRFYIWLIILSKDFPFYTTTFWSQLNQKPHVVLEIWKKRL